MVIFENDSDQQTVLRDVFSNDPQLLALLKETENSKKTIQTCLSLIAEQKKKFIPPEMCEMAEPFPEIYKGYNQLLLKQNALDFDDILFYAYQILTENPSVVKLYNSLYKYICVDEAQDLNFAQYEVIKALCGNECKNIMLVGDENQSIYGFNGSDSRLMSQRFIEDFEPVTYVLNENYRSARAIVKFANQLKNYESIANYVYEGELSGFCFEDEEKEAEFVLARIEELIEKGHSDIEKPVKYDSFAVIARNRYVFNKIEELFSKKDIPHFYKKNASSIETESEYMKVFELGIRLLLNAKDVLHLRELCKIVNADINNVSIYNEGYAVLKHVIQNSTYRSLIDPLGMLNDSDFNFTRSLLSLKASIPETVEDDEKYLIMNDINQWETHWKKYVSQVQRENRTLLSFRNYISLGKTQDASSNKGVALLTAHMSKGLQYEVVFVIGLSEGTFPDYRAVNRGGAELEQEKNNMYVAVTRAKRLCYLSYPKNKLMPWGDVKKQVPSRFVKMINITEAE